jgi:LPXTG-motif cell wall-anchored protein
MPMDAMLLLLAQTTTETGETSQTSWFPFLIAGLLMAVLIAAFLVRRARRAHGDPPAGSVPAGDVPNYLQSGRMSPPPDETRRS